MSADSFFSRWSKRKQEAREAEPVAAPAVVGAPVVAAPVVEQRPDQVPADAPPAPSLQEAESLKPEDDFTRFVGSEVSPEVKNTALKKLFTDPHFNRMDGLDVYIDDYSKPDPLPEGTLRQLAGGKVLGLFREEEEETVGAEMEGKSTTDGVAHPDQGCANFEEPVQTDRDECL